MAIINQIGSNITGICNFVSINGGGNIVAIGQSNNNKTKIYEWNGTNWSQLGGDINGEASGDESGTSVSLNNGGNIVAIGAIQNDGISGNNSGHTRIYEYNSISNTWTQLGGDIDGEASGDESGYSVSLNNLGNIIAIGANKNDGGGNMSGHTRIYEYNSINNVWEKLGQDIDGEASYDESGTSVSLNSLGNIVVIGAYKNDEGGNMSGHTRIYEYDSINDVWEQLGQDINGGSAYDRLGVSVSLNDDGNIVAIGVPKDDGTSLNSGDNRGSAKIFKYNSVNNVWNQLGQDIDGEAAGDESGWSVSLNSSGYIIAIGSPKNDGTSLNSGDNRGQTRIFQYNSFDNVWYQIGNDIDGEANGDQFGISVSLNKYGNTVVITSSNSNYVQIYGIQTIEQLGPNIGGETRAVSMNRGGTKIATGIPNHNNDTGRTKIYEWNGTIWSQLGGNINGNYWNDFFGESVSLNRYGNIVAIGALGLNDSRGHIGYTKIYEYDSINNIWNQLGGDIYGEDYNGYFGKIVSLNDDGNIVAIGAMYNDGTSSSTVHNIGQTKIFEYNSSSNTWEQLGGSIIGEAAYDWSGKSVSLNSQGNIIAIGATRNDGTSSSNKFNCGSTRIYQYDASKTVADANGPIGWNKLGQDIDGEASDDFSGGSVSLNSQGNIVAIGAFSNDGGGSNSGSTRIYEYDSINNVWEKLGQDIDGEAAGDQSGGSVSLNSAGDIVAIGAHEHNGGVGTKSGQLRIYKYDSSASWVQYGLDIDGQSASDHFGHSVSINGKGNRVIVSTTSNYTKVYELKLLNNLKKEVINSNITMNNDVTNGVDVTYKRILTTDPNIYSFNAYNVPVPNGNPSYMMLSLDALDGSGNIITGLTGLTGNDRIYVEIEYTNYNLNKGYHLIKYDGNNYVVSPDYPVPLTPVTNKTNTLGGYLTGLSNIGLTLNTVTCFLGNVKILCYDMTTKSEYYNEIKNIKENDYIKTFGTEKEYSKVIYLNKEITCNEERILKKKRLYQHKVHKDIILTGIHSLLYDDLSEELYKNMIDETNWKDDFMKVGDKKKLMTHLDPDFKIYNEVENTFVYQIGIQSKNDTLSYGLYLEHNLYAETTSIKSINKKNKLYNLDLIKS